MWRKSSHSFANSNCVEVAAVDVDALANAWLVHHNALALPHDVRRLLAKAYQDGFAAALELRSVPPSGASGMRKPIILDLTDE